MSKIAIEEQLTLLIEQAVRDSFAALPKKAGVNAQAVKLEIPKERTHGDISTNIALRLTSQLKMNPVNIADSLVLKMKERLPGSGLEVVIDRVEVVKPGFINFWYTRSYLAETLDRIQKEGPSYGFSASASMGKVIIEFVSANPTGPLTVAHGRQAAIGDALGNILKAYGYAVTKEYFINDEGRQINVLGESIRYHYLSEFGIAAQFPEDGYRGGYIKDIALEIKTKFGDKYTKAGQDDRAFFSAYGTEAILGIIKKDLKEFGVHFDSWFSQRVLTNELILDVLDGLRKKGHVFDQEGAVWFRSTAFGDDKDRVVTKSDGSFTYFAPDIAYHLDKYRRAFDKVVNIWGPDHHGYIPRLTAAIEALGFDKRSLSVLIVQLATLYRNGEVVRMSTRAGEFITLKEVMDEVGKDVTRFFFLMRKLDSHLDFDIEVAKKQSTDNPVYYIQYAHARIWSIKEFGQKLEKDLAGMALDVSRLKEKEEVDLIRLLAQFPAYIRDSAVTLEPYYMILYLNELAALFHNFYTKHKVVTDDLALSKARLYLVDCIRICLANGLSLLGVSLPKKM